MAILSHYLVGSEVTLYIYIRRRADFHVTVQFICTHWAAGTQSPYLYVCWSVHSGVSIISGSSWFPSALPLTDSVVHRSNWEPCVCITQHVMNWKQRLQVLFPPCVHETSRDIVSAAVWGLRGITTIIKCMWEWTKWPSEGHLMPESEAEEKNED